MNAQSRTQIIGLSILLISAILLAGCQGLQASPADAASAPEVAAADRKFYNAAALEEGIRLAEVSPADRKFYNTREIVTVAAIAVEPADRKFYNSSTAAVETASTTGVTGIHPADLKFHSLNLNRDSGNLELNIHPADRKYLSNSSIDPADRKFFNK